CVVLAEFASFLGRDKPFEDSAENIRSDFLEIKWLQVAKHRTPGIRRIWMLKYQRPCPIFFTRIKNRLIIARFLDHAFERRVEISVQIRWRLYAGSQFQTLEIFEFRADRFVKNQAVCEDITNRSRGSINKFAPTFRCANYEPSLLACHPFL